jgi:hypothetical protein
VCLCVCVLCVCVCVCVWTARTSTEMCVWTAHKQRQFIYFYYICAPCRADAEGWVQDKFALRSVQECAVECVFVQECAVECVNGPEANVVDLVKKCSGM